jgi:heme-degrading monooxygenase HmoA
MPPNLAQEFRNHLGSDLLANAKKAQGFIRSSYGKSLQQQNDKFMVITFILWDNIQAHQQFANGQICTQFG